MKPIATSYWHPILATMLIFAGCSKGQVSQPASAADIEAGIDYRLAWSVGFGLSPDQVQVLKTKIQNNPEDVRSRAELMGYYSRGKSTSPDDRVARRQQVLWMIQNRPADPFSSEPPCQMDPVMDPEGYSLARNLWMKQVDQSPQSPAVLGNAARFLMRSDFKASESLFNRASSADPQNPEWPKSLALLHMFERINTKGVADRQALAKQALSEYERSLSMIPNAQSRFYLVTEMLNVAFEAGDFAKATQYADQTLATAEGFRGDWNYGNAIYNGNVTLGRIALANGDVESAKAHLLAAAKTPGSPQLNSFGPNVSLARDLLAKGEKKTVLEYFDLCSKFWSMGADSIKSWTLAVQNGGQPQWDVNLNY